ncbi:MAG: hypothetical protein HRU18_06760 [Pseudoalteromonas sp.]|uniref:portal protein n=1 Tax=Pseudoalteromonas sp. TaxID=53249 RepID=UPI001DC6AD8F|nr:hypothetical protein [Pseudoalteromonas sp.]NRA77891.1 hypothetical protein [Pseudoalteromonas sp.]
MKPVIKDLQDTFKVGYEAYEGSHKEAATVWDLYHNRQYTEEQLTVLANRGQPAESFNVIKLFSRMLIGYYSTIINTVVVEPLNPRDTIPASVLNHTIESVLRANRFDIEGDTIKLGGIISGLLCCHSTVQDSGARDQFNRPINEIEVKHVNEAELVLDPSSVNDDYSDAEWLHRFRWLSESRVIKQFGEDALKELEAYNNHLNVDEAEFEFNYGSPFTGHYRVFDNFLIVHTVMEEPTGKRWSIFWSGDTILKKTEITSREVRWPYRIQKLQASNKPEFYGVFREIIQSQYSLNQAILKIQLMVNSNKVFVQEKAVEDMAEFTDAYNRVTGVIKVLKISGIKVVNMNADIQQQYIIVDKTLERIQKVLGINDSFLGQAFASDSGRKVKLQQNATIMSLRYVTARIESFYQSLGGDIAKLAKQYYTANQIISIVDTTTGQQWFEINKPIEEFSGEMAKNGEPIMRPVLLPMENPDDGELLLDDDGNIIMAPVSEEWSDYSTLAFTTRIEANSFNDEDEKAQLMLESVMSGQIGGMMMNVNPAGFIKMSALSIKSMKTRYSPDIVQILEETAAMLPQGVNADGANNPPTGGKQPMSKSLKLPQNTNEGAV